jgi:hypothetical protein
MHLKELHQSQKLNSSPTFFFDDVSVRQTFLVKINMKKEISWATLWVVFVWTWVSFANDQVPISNTQVLPDITNIELNDDEFLWKLGKASEVISNEFFHLQFGLNGEQNFTAAMNYYNQSAELGNEKAQSSLGFFWETGKLGQTNDAVVGIVELSIFQALIYYAFAAEQQDMTANMALAYRYHVGQGVQKSCSSAVYRYQKVAEEGNYQIF